VKDLSCYDELGCMLSPFSQPVSSLAARGALVAPRGSVSALCAIPRAILPVTGCVVCFLFSPVPLPVSRGFSTFVDVVTVDRVHCSVSPTLLDWATSRSRSCCDDLEAKLSFFFEVSLDSKRVLCLQASGSRFRRVFRL